MNFVCRGDKHSMKKQHFMILGQHAIILGCCTFTTYN